MAGEIGLSLHKMQEVSRLYLGDFPYKEHAPTSLELDLLKYKNLELIGVYSELLCHFFVCRVNKNWRK